MEPRPGGAAIAGGARDGPTSRPAPARVGRWLCIGGALLGALGLLDAIAGTGVLTVLPVGEAAMTRNSALGLLLIGGAAASRDREDAGPLRRGLSLLAAMVVLAIGSMTLVQHTLHIDLHVDWLLSPGGSMGGYDGRPAPVTALALALLAGALVLLDFRPRARARPSEWLAFAAGFAALTAVLGFIFGAELHHGIAPVPLIGAALPTAVGLLLISVGFLLERPAAGFMRVATSSGPGGLQFRRFVLPAILVPVVLGVVVTFPLRFVGRDALAVVVAVLASAMCLVGLLVLAGTAASLNRTYEALEWSRARTRTMFEHAPDGVFIADLTGRYTDVNDAGCRLLGHSREEILGKTIADLLPPEDAERLAQTRSQLLRGDTEKGEWRLRRKDGSYVATEVSSKIFPDGRWQALVRDISDRKRLEAELRVAEAEQKFLAELGSALVSTIDDRETVEVVARQIVTQLADACSVETLEENGQLHERVVVHRDPAKTELCRRLEQMQRDGSRPYPGPAVRETRKPMLVGDITPAYLESITENAEHRQAMRELDPKSFLAVPLLAHGGVVGSLVFISTSAGRRYTRQDLPFAQAVAMRAALAIEKARLYRIAQHAIRLREDVLSVVAHDLRNPLGTILMQTALLRRRGDEQDRPKRKPAEVIERAATRMNRLIQDLLDVARMEGGRLSIEQGRVSARQVIADAIQAHEQLAAAAAVQLRVDAAAALPELWADRSRLLQIFENLIGNAIKFTEPGGRITLGAVPGDGHVLFWVADTGAGIAEEHLPRLFERLWQASKAGQQGAGLGLPIVKGIVEAHGGHIWVESKAGAGSTFFFTIPNMPAPEHRPAEPAPSPAP
jgi:PAS domain S-box-containing protein